MIRRLVDRLLDWWRRRHQRQPQHLPRAATRLEPTLTVELIHSEVMESRLRDPVYRALV